MPEMFEVKNTRTESEPVFLDALKQGDFLAYDRLVKDNRNRLVAAAFRIVGNREDALDVVQEAFLAAYLSMHRFRGGAKTSTWLYRITVNAALMHLRKRKTRHEQAIDDDTQDQLLRTEDPSTGTPEELLEAKETLRHLDDRFQRLPKAHRSVFVLRDLQDHGTDQTARRLGISTNAVKIRLHRARRALRDGIGETASLEKTA